MLLPTCNRWSGVCASYSCGDSESGWQFLCMEAGDVSPLLSLVVVWGGYMDAVALIQGIYNDSCSL